MVRQFIASNLKTLSQAAVLFGIGLILSLSRGNLVVVVGAQAQDITISASFSSTQSLNPFEQINLRLNRRLDPAEGQLAVFIGQTDVTGLLETNEQVLSYSPKVFPLPPGDNELSVYLVAPDKQWKEIARFPLRVEKASSVGSQTTVESSNKNGLGHRKFDFVPVLTLNLKSQPTESHFPGANRPDRGIYTDFSVQGGLQTKVESVGFRMQSQFDVVGSSYQKEALRFAQRGNDAPQIDLAAYLMQFSIGKAKVMAGNVAYGANRYLINNFSSRGVSIMLPLGSRTDFSFAAMNGASVVGWDNFFGLDNRKHQIITGTMGFEFLRKRQGGLRLEGSLLSGSLLPISGYNQNNINDAERSRGAAIRIVASDQAQRLKLDAGLTESIFTNPKDPLLDRDRQVVPTRESTRSARYLDFSYALLRNFSLSEAVRSNLVLNYRHEKVDPLFRSVAAFVQPNKSQNQFEAVGGIGNINATFSHLRFNDNLDDIPSLLKSLTRRNGLIIGAPLAALFSTPTSPSGWLPRLAYTFDRTHQFGAFTPVNGDFKPPQVPNQIGTNQGLLAEWQGNSYWRFGYRFNHSSQDNFGEKREGAKLNNLINGVTLGLNPRSTLDLNVDVNAERLNSLDTNGNKDKDRTDRSLRFGVGVNWRMPRRMALSANLSNTTNNSLGDLSKSSDGRNTQFDLQWSWRFAFEQSRWKKTQGQFFIRYANRYASSRAELFGLSNLMKAQTLNLGISFTFF